MDESAFFLRSRRLLGYSVSDQSALDAAIAANPQSAAAQVTNDNLCSYSPPFFRSTSALNLDPYVSSLFFEGIWRLSYHLYSFPFSVGPSALRAGNPR
jgi:hypothetical protein